MFILMVQYLKPLLLILIFVTAHQAFGQEWIQTNGPEAALVRVLTEANETLYAAGGGSGLFVSKDRGHTWQLSKFKGIAFEVFASDQSIFVNTGTEVYLSNNDGASWSKTSITRPRSFLADSGKMLFATYDAHRGLYISTNNGKSWAIQDSEIFVSKGYVELHSLFKHKGAVFAVRSLSPSNATIIRSFDFGHTWDTVAHPNKIGHLGSVGDSLYLIQDSISYVSTDMGNTWQAIATLASGSHISQASISSEAIRFIAWEYDSLGRQLYSSYMLNNNKWQQEEQAASLLLSNNKLFLTIKDDIATMHDGESTYKADGFYCSRIGVMEAFDNTLFASWNGIQFSTANGDKWFTFSSDSSYGRAIKQFLHTDNDLFALTTHILKYNKSQGFLPLTNQPSDTIMSLAVQHNILFAATPKALFKSSDLGKSWVGISHELLQNISSISGLFADEKRIILGSDSSLYLSTDQGESWQYIIDNLASGIKQMRTIGDTIIALTNNGSIAYFTMTELTWRLIPPLGISPKVTSFTTIKDELLIGYDNGEVYSTTNLGEDVVKIGKDLPSSALSIASNNGWFFAGTAFNGVLRIMHPFSSVQLPSTSFGELTCYPNPSNGSILLTYSLSKEEEVTIVLYNSIGKQVKKIEQGLQLRGTYVLSLETEDLPAGTYQCLLLTSRGITHRLTLIHTR